MNNAELLNETIGNLEATSEALEKAANNPSNYNTYFSMSLEQISWEMYRMANQLKMTRDVMGM